MIPCIKCGRCNGKCVQSLNMSSTSYSTYMCLAHILGKDIWKHKHDSRYAYKRSTGRMHCIYKIKGWWRSRRLQWSMWSKLKIHVVRTLGQRALLARSIGNFGNHSWSKKALPTCTREKYI